MPWAQWPPPTCSRQLNLNVAPFASVPCNWGIWHVRAVSSRPGSGAVGTRLQFPLQPTPRSWPSRTRCYFLQSRKEFGGRGCRWQGTQGWRETWRTRTTCEEEWYFSCGLCRTKNSRKRESLAADLLTQSHAGVSENTKMSRDRLALILMLELKVIFAINCCSQHYLSWCSLGL